MSIILKRKDNMSDTMHIIYGALVKPKHNEFWIKLLDLDPNISEENFWTEIKTNIRSVGGHNMASINQKLNVFRFVVIYKLFKDKIVKGFNIDTLPRPDKGEGFNNFCDYLNTFGLETDKTQIQVCFVPVRPKDHPLYSLVD